MPGFAALSVRAAWITALLFCAAAGITGCSKEAPPPQRPVPEVTVITVEPRDIPYVPNFVAQTESSRQVNIVARVSGFLDRIAYQEGQLVREGQLLFQLDPKPFQAQLAAVRSQAEAYTHHVNVFKAGGGGWVDEAEKLAPRPTLTGEAAAR